jgi:FkbM family methyltransferase
MAFSKSRFPKVNIEIKDINFKMMVDLKDSGLSHDLLACGIREYPNVLYLIDFIKKYRKEIDTPIDIGANIGYYALLVNKIFEKYQQKNRLVLAIEPVKSSFELLQKNLALNGFKNVMAINAAIGEADKRVIMAVPQRKNLSHIKDVVKTSKMIKSYKEELVDMLSLKKLFTTYGILPKNVLFRFDIEGYEYQLLRGNKEFFKNLQQAFMVMEFHPFLLKEQEAVNFLELLKEVGFKLDMVVSCYPLYFLCVPKFLRNILKITWVWEKENDSLGKIKRLKSIDNLLAEVHDRQSPLYTHPNLHLYLVKR